MPLILPAGAPETIRRYAEPWLVAQQAETMEAVIGGASKLIPRRRVADFFGVETLAEHQAGFAMRIACFAQDSNMRRQSHIAGDFFPYEMERIVREPHVFAAARDTIGLLARSVLERPTVKGSADLLLPIKKTADGQRLLRSGVHQGGAEQEG